MAVKKRTILLQESKSFHITALSPQGIADIRGHAACSYDIAANTFGTVECAGVLREADKAMLARRVRGACRMIESAPCLELFIC